VARRPDAPSIGVLATGGIAVIVVLLFVAAVAVGGSPRRTPGDRVDVVRSAGPAGVTVLAGRCRDQRVTEVALFDAGGDPVWRIASAKGSIDRRYVVGGDAPLGFEEVVPFEHLPEGPVTAVVTFDRPGDDPEEDRRTVDPAAAPFLRAQLADAAPPCSDGTDLGPTVAVFAVGAVVVVGGYGLMVARWWSDRSGRRP
jgi:hypothetical protein